MGLVKKTMPDKWDIHNETIGNIISEARSLTTTEIMSVRSQLKDLCYSKKTLKKTQHQQFSNEERIRMIQPNGLRGKILTYLFRNISWEKQKPEIFTRKNLAGITGKKQSQISTAAKKLIQLGLISMHRAFFPETHAFRNCYNLTISGVYAARWLIKNSKKGR